MKKITVFKLNSQSTHVFFHFVEDVRASLNLVSEFYVMAFSQLQLIYTNNKLVMFGKSSYIFTTSVGIS